MLIPPPAKNEAERLAVLQSYGVLDTPAEKDFDDLVDLAAHICGAPMAFISLVDADRQWFKASYGLTEKETPRDISFCGHTILQKHLFVVPDATTDARFADNPLVTGNPSFRFYAGAPLVAPEGQTLGALCVMDRQPRQLTPEQEHALLVLSRHVMAQLELRRQTRQMTRVNRTLLGILEDEWLAEAARQESEELNRGVLNSVLAHIAVLDRDGKIIAVNEAWRKFARENVNGRQELLARTEVGTNYLDACRTNDPESQTAVSEVLKGLQAVLRDEKDQFTYEYPCDAPNRKRWFILSATPLPTARGGAAVSHLEITERKLAEEQLLWKTAFLEAQVNSAFDGILIVDDNGKILLQNQLMIDLWRLPKELIDNPDDKLRLQWVTEQLKNPRQFAEKVACLYAHPDEVSRDELELKDGRYFDRYSAPVRGTDGRYYGRIWVFRDITERKESEKALQRERDFSSAVLDTAGSLVVVLDPKACIVGFNRACELVSGYSFEDVKGRNAFELLLVPEELTEVSAMFDRLRAGQFPTSIENHWVTKSGSRRLIAWSNTALLGADGTVEYIIGTGIDITERKQSERKIAEQAAFLDKARDAIQVRDLEGRILFWNEGAERVYGWKSEEVVGRPIIELLYRDPKKFQEVNGLTISQGEWHGELQHLTRGRGEITVEARWTLIRDDRGEPKSILAINTDITEKKKIEAQFMRAQRMESIGTLAGGIAHDLNNILAPIMMSIEMLKETSTDPQADRILETIQVSAQRGADIVRQVLSFARGLEGERIEIQPRHLMNDLQRIIKDTFPKDIDLSFTIAPDTWTILGDPTQIHQVLLNLCVNARDAMPNGGTLSVEMENRELDEHYAAMNLQAKAGSYLKISVTDSGIGIPPELVDKIFEPFFTTKDLNKGTGLGLSTVMAIVKSHEGVINVYSELGSGTTFTVDLPALTGSDPQWTEPLGQDRLPRGKGETVLIADDEASIISITGQTLQAFGYRVLTAIDGAEAVAVYAQHQEEIAVVLSDMAMPVMDGPATIHAIMRINPKVKIIAASGLNVDGRVTRAAGVGVKHFLTKPYTAGTLLKMIRTVLEET